MNGSVTPGAGDIQNIPVHANEDGTFDYWKIPLLSLVVNGLTIPLSPGRLANSPNQLPVLVVDSGTTLILGPEQDVNAIYSLSQTARRRKDTKASDGQGSWELDCTEAMDVKFSFVKDVTSHEDARAYAMDPLDISWDGIKSEDGLWCLGGIQANDNVCFWPRISP